MSAYRYLHSYNPKWRFSTWIYRIAIRNSSRQRRVDMVDAGEMADADAVDPLESCIAATERENAWLTARRLLSDDAYAAMWLRYAEDLSIKEVAQAAGGVHQRGRSDHRGGRPGHRARELHLECAVHGRGERDARRAAGADLSPLH